RVNTRREMIYRQPQYAEPFRYYPVVHDLTQVVEHRNAALHADIIPEVEDCAMRPGRISEQRKHALIAVEISQSHCAIGIDGTGAKAGTDHDIIFHSRQKPIVEIVRVAAFESGEVLLAAVIRTVAVGKGVVGAESPLAGDD